jgi:hypothetical protein
MRPSVFLRMAGSALAFLVLFGCHVETNRERALYAKHNAAIRRLLVALDLHKNQKGALPSSLEELSKSDAEIRDIAIAEYVYSPEGIIVADGSRWLVAVSDPVHRNQLIVGTLPVKVAVKTPRNN